MAASEKKDKILVIEGDAGFGELISQALNKEGYEATLVKNGSEGLKLIYDTLPRLIILDILLSGTDGYDILAKKDADSVLKKIPVFLMSTQGLPINMQKVPKGSVTEFIVTFQADVTDIIEKVNRHFNREAKSSVASSPIPEGDRKKVLWVEDDKLIGTILAKKLISSGFDLFHAKHGEEAMEALKSIVPDVIVLDLLLPGMSGFDILQKMKADERLKIVPVMILSNMNKPSDVERAKVLGVKKYLVKAANSLDQIVLEIKELCK